MLGVHEHSRKYLSLMLVGSRRFTYANHKRLACICFHILKLELDAVTETRARSVGFAHVPQLVSLAPYCAQMFHGYPATCHVLTSIVIDGSFSFSLVAASR